MKKGVVTTGIAFLIAVVLIASANYLVISNQSQNKAVTEKMKIDAVINRESDVKWIINKTMEEGIDQGNNCSDTASIIEDNLNSVQGSSLLDTGAAETTINSISVDSSNCPDIQVSVNYIVETDDENVQKEVNFQEEINLPNYTVISFPTDGNAWGYTGWGDCSSQTGSWSDINNFCECKGYKGAAEPSKGACYHESSVSNRYTWSFNSSSADCISEINNEGGGTALTQVRCYD